MLASALNMRLGLRLRSGLKMKGHALPAADVRRLSSIADNSELAEYWMPFTHNRHFKTVETPKMFHRADG